MNSSRLAAISCALALGFLAGCGGSRIWTSTFVSEDGHAKLDTARVAIEFEAVPMVLSPGEVSGGGSASLQIGGWGTSETQITSKGKVLTTSYRDGVNRITIDSFEVKILDDGQKVQVGGQAFDLGAAKKIIVVHADGTATLR